MVLIRKPIYDFADFQHVENFRPVNDAVMGGVSESRFVYDPTLQCAVFSGNVSFESGGGFASVRSLPYPEDVRGRSRFIIGVQGDDKRYHFRIKQDEGFEGVVYDVAFTARAQFAELEFLADAFTPVVRGRAVVGAPPLAMDVVWSFGFLIGDRQEGPFRLEVSFISAL